MDDPTFLTNAVTRAETTGVPSTSAPPIHFAPGAIISGRYRLVAQLGKGGMGEVYRADDLILDQPVALKFLPPGAEDEAWLAQLHNELKVARQVSHKNVCRLYDLGEAGGRRFLTMEHVDGEDLASLLRRIGRLPHDKAVQMARQLCAGIAAAHERGVIHRDLKPANVMIDGQGDVRITDFGIATATADSVEFVGTPQYMAPEQFAGAAASIKSDVYALGLILFEINSLGYAEPVGDTASGFMAFADYRQWLRRQALGPRRWDVLSTGDPSAILFWYRSSPRQIVPVDEDTVSLDDPPSIETGMREVVLDPRGRLQRFRSVPPQFDESTGPAVAPSWNTLFDAAGLSMSSFVEATPQWAPPDYADARAAWTGPHPTVKDVTLRIEAAAS